MKLLRKITLVTTIILGINLALPVFVLAQSPPYTFSFQFGTFGSGNGQLNDPEGIAIDASGNIYVADYGNNRIQKFNSSGVYQSQFGTFGSGDGQFQGTFAITIDAPGDIYVTDLINHRVQKFNSSGVYQSQFGTLGNGDGQFQRAFGIAVNATGDIYVSDFDNHRIEKFNSSGTFVGAIGMVTGTSGTCPSSGTTAGWCTGGTFASGSGDGQFNYPVGVALDASGNIYVADSNNSRVQKFNSSGIYQSQFGGFGGGNGQFIYPEGIMIDTSGKIYVASDLRIQIFNSSGVYQSQFGAPGRGIAIDASRNIYVSDQVNDRIRVFAPVVPVTSFGQGEEVIQPGVLQLSSVPANFTFPAVEISEFQTYDTIYTNTQTALEKLTAQDLRFSGGFEVQMTATEYVGQNNPANRIAVGNLGALTQIPNGTDNYVQTTNLENVFSAGSGTLITGSAAFGAVVTQTLPFNFPMFGRESDQIYICTSGIIAHSADLVGLTAADFNDLCSGIGAAPGGVYSFMYPYNLTAADKLSTQTGAGYDPANGVYYQEISASEVRLRWRAGIRNSDNFPTGESVEFTVALHKDGRIEYHYGPISDATHIPFVAISVNGGTLINGTEPPINPLNTGDLYTSQKIRFTPVSTIFNDVSKPGTPPVFTPINANSVIAENFTMFTEDVGNPGFSVAMTIIQGAACLNHGRLGDYSLYPSFLLQIPPQTVADTYQNTITFTSIDNTLPNGSQFCPLR